VVESLGVGGKRANRPRRFTENQGHCRPDGRQNGRNRKVCVEERAQQENGSATPREEGESISLGEYRESERFRTGERIRIGEETSARGA